MAYNMVYVQHEICRAISVISDGDTSTKVRCVVDPNVVSVYHNHQTHTEKISCECLHFCECPW